MTSSTNRASLIERLEARIAEHRAHIAQLEAEYGRGSSLDERNAAIVLNFGDVIDLATTLRAKASTP